MLDTLTERERKVLELRFGLVDGYSRTLEEVGKQFKVTRERIRQIEAKALRKMRHPTRIRQLTGFFDAEQPETRQQSAQEGHPAVGFESTAAIGRCPLHAGILQRTAGAPLRSCASRPPRGAAARRQALRRGRQPGGKRRPYRPDQTGVQ